MMPIYSQGVVLSLRRYIYWHEFKLLQLMVYDPFRFTSTNSLQAVVLCLGLTKDEVMTTV